MWKLITLGVSVIGLVGAILWHINTDNKRVKELTQAKDRIATLETDNRGLGAERDQYKERVKKNNDEWRKKLAAEEERTAKAKISAREAVEARDIVSAELAEARRAWREELERDPSLQEFISLNVPDAVWNRLRSASGQAQ